MGRKKRIEDWKPPVLPLRRQCYSDEDFEKTLAAVPVQITWRAKARLRKKIEAAATWFLMSRAENAKPPPSERAQRFQMIKSTAERLLSTLGVRDKADPLEMPFAVSERLRRMAEKYGEDKGEYPDIPSTEWSVEGVTIIDYHGDTKLRRAIHGVQLLHTWARMAREEAEAEVIKTKSAGPARHKRDEALHVLVIDLARAYREIFEREPGVSRPSGTRQPGGPFIRFLGACLKPVGEGRSRDAIRELWRRVRNDFQANARPPSKLSR